MTVSYDRLTVERVTKAYRETGIKSVAGTFNADMLCEGKKPCFACAVTAVLIHEKPMEELVKLFSSGATYVTIASALGVPVHYLTGFVAAFDRPDGDYSGKPDEWELGVQDGIAAHQALNPVKYRAADLGATLD